MAVEEARVPMLHDREKYAHSKHNETPPPPTKPLSVAESHRHLGSPTLVITSLVAGAIAGALAKTTIAPLDRTKINFQISQTPYSWKAAIGFLMHSAKTEGFIALWRGNSATIARIAPYAAIQFTAHEQWKRVLGVDTPHTAQQHRVRHLMAGSLAGVTSQSLTYPLDLARARMAVTQAHQYRTITAVFVKVAGEEGLRTLYRGYPATVMGVVPYAGFSFFTYDSLKHKYLDITGSLPSGAVNVVFGGAAGALGQTASYPLDIVRRRMQTAHRRPDGTYPYATIGATLSTVYKSEGWRGFFKGLSMNWVKGPVAVGISFATYDAIKMGLRDVASKLNS